MCCFPSRRPAGSLGAPPETRQDASVRTRWRVVLIVALLLLGVYAALPALSELPAIRAWTVARLEQATAWQVRFAQLRVQLRPVSHPDSALGRPTRTVAVSHRRPCAALAAPGWTVRRSGAARPRRGAAPAHGGAAGAIERWTRCSPPVVLEHAEIVDAVRASCPPATRSRDHRTAVAGGRCGARRARPARAQRSRASWPSNAGTVSWSAELWRSTLAPSHGSLSVDAASPIDAVRAWFAAPLPASVTPTSAAAQLDWRGTEPGRSPLDVETGLADADQRRQRCGWTGSGEIDPAQSGAHLTLAGAQWAFRSSDASRAASGIDLRIDLTARGAATRVCAPTSSSAFRPASCSGIASTSTCGATALTLRGPGGHDRDPD